MLAERIQDRWSIKKCIQESPHKTVLEEKRKLAPPVELISDEMSAYFRREKTPDYRLRCVANRIHRLSGKGFNPVESILLARKLLYSDDTKTRSYEYITREMKFVAAHAADILVDGSTILKERHDISKDDKYKNSTSNSGR